jgi:hypothetical protein
MRTVLFSSAEISHPPSMKNPPRLLLEKGKGGGFKLPSFINFYHRKPEESMRKGAFPAFTSEKT